MCIRSTARRVAALSSWSGRCRPRSSSPSGISSVLPLERIIARSTRLASSLTFPGQACRRSALSASLGMTSTCRFIGRASCRTKNRTSAGMSSGRSRSGGTWMGKTFKRRFGSVPGYRRAPPLHARLPACRRGHGGRMCDQGRLRAEQPVPRNRRKKPTGRTGRPRSPARRRCHPRSAQSNFRYSTRSCFSSSEQIRTSKALLWRLCGDYAQKGSPTCSFAPPSPRFV